MATDDLNANGEIDLFTVVDDELFDELTELTGQKIVYVAIWEETLADALDESAANPEEQTAFDLDLYLEEGVFFELYDTLCYPTLEGDPIQGMNTVAQQLSQLANEGLWLEEVAVDENDGLVLILGHERQSVLYLAVGGWFVDEWDELPE